jgi:hypothetical protein
MRRPEPLWPGAPLYAVVTCVPNQRYDTDPAHTSDVTTPSACRTGAAHSSEIPRFTHVWVTTMPTFS